MASLSLAQPLPVDSAPPPRTVAVLGEAEAAWPLVRRLGEAGFPVLLCPSSCVPPQQPRSLATPFIAVLSSMASVERLDAAIRGADGGWLGWDLSGEPAVALAAYGRGARAVVPASAEAAVLASLLAGASPPPSQDTSSGRRREYRRGDRLSLSDQHVITVARGVVALSVLHSDGTDALLGLSGPGDVIVGHPDDRCCLQLTAHTDVSVDIVPWATAVRAPDFALRLRSRLRGMEAWSAAQARPHLRDRLLGLLDLLAEQFGVPDAAMVVVDVRLTHAQLASAIGATRATVTRVLAQLARRRLLDVVRRGTEHRFCLLSHDRGLHHHHDVRSPRV